MEGTDSELHVTLGMEHNTAVSTSNPINLTRIMLVKGPSLVSTLQTGVGVVTTFSAKWQNTYQDSRFQESALTRESSTVRRVLVHGTPAVIPPFSPCRHHRRAVAIIA